MSGFSLETWWAAVFLTCSSVLLRGLSERTRRWAAVSLSCSSCLLSVFSTRLCQWAAVSLSCSSSLLSRLFWRSCWRAVVSRSLLLLSVSLERGRTRGLEYAWYLSLSLSLSCCRLTGSSLCFFLRFLAWDDNSDEDALLSLGMFKIDDVVVHARVLRL